MTRAERRQDEQLKFLKSGEEILVGNVANLPIPLNRLLKMEESSPEIVRAISKGLTAHIYKLRAGGEYWTLKRKRDKIAVQNADGQTSFLNEIQRRAEFEELKRVPKNAVYLSGIVDTNYASLLQGIILSPWIDGEEISEYNRSNLESIFKTLHFLSINGFFEWDLCPGNLIENDGKVTLFDFGYMYRYNPLKDFNSDGTDNPVFHPAERFETRSFFGYLLDLESTSGMDAVLRQLVHEKEIALKWYEETLRYLESAKAEDYVIKRYRELIEKWNTALSSPDHQNRLYLTEGFRSWVLDVHDDLSGKTCTPHTIKKLTKATEILGEHYDLLKQEKAFFFGDEKLNQDELIKKYKKDMKNVEKYQIG